MKETAAEREIYSNQNIFKTVNSSMILWPGLLGCERVGRRRRGGLGRAVKGLKGQRGLGCGSYIVIGVCELYAWVMEKLGSLMSYSLLLAT